MLLKLDFSLDIPIYQQIRNQIVLGIANGDLKPGEKLPPIRTLASETGINTMTVNKAYQVLKQEGYLITDRRSGAMVNPDRTAPDTSRLSEHPGLRLLISEFYTDGVTKDELIRTVEDLYQEFSLKKQTE